MSDINLNFGSKDLEALLKNLNKLAKDLSKSVGKLAPEDAVTRSKKIAVEALKTQNAMDRQKIAAQGVADRQEKINAKQKEGLGIIGSLESKQKQYRSAIKSAQTELEKKGAQKQLERVSKELVKAKGNTATWGKALGSFQFKFNALGNIAANALSKITGALKRGINEFTSFEKIMRSNQLTSDRYDQIMGRLKGSFNALNRSIALGDFKGLAENMKNAADAAMDYVLALDFIGDSTNALNIQNSRTKREVKELQEVYNDTSQDKETRMAAALKAQDAINVMQERSDRIGKLSVEAQLKKAQTEFNLTEEQTKLYQRFFENYGLLSDKQITQMEQLETATVKAAETKIGFLDKLGETYAQEATGVDDFTGEVAKNNEALSNQAKIAKELSDTFGFDVNPIMEAIINTNNETRASFAQNIITYEEEQKAIQKLATTLAPIIGIIRKLKDENEELTTSFENLTTGDKTDISAKQIESDNNLGKVLKANAADRIKENKKNIADDLQLIADTEEKKQQLKRDTFNAAADLSNSLTMITEANKQRELSAAGDNAEKRLEIEKKYLKKQQALSISQAIINQAQAISEVWKTWAENPPVAIAFSALAALNVGAQIATIKSQKFAKGGEVDGRLHSQGGTLIEAEKGEFVINRSSTSKYKSLIEGINENDQLKIMSALDQDRKIPTVKQDPYMKKMYEFMIAQENYGETKEYFIINKGNQKIMIRKNE